MPELPEVETVRRQLLDHVVGKTIAHIEVRADKSAGHDDEFESVLVGAVIDDITRAGKYLFFHLSGVDTSFLIGHLKMTGRMIYIPASSSKQVGGGHTLQSEPDSQPHKHTRLIFEFTDNSHLYFNDMRKFGYMKRASASDVEAVKDKLGIEPIEDAYEKDWFREVFAGRQTTVKAILLQQKDIAGIGNIYADEACWRAKVRPDRVADTLTGEECELLFKATTAVLSEAIALGGTTFKNFADTGGQHGNFTDELDVFGREGKDCPRCGAKITKTRVAGRGTHWCPDCQQ